MSSRSSAKALPVRDQPGDPGPDRVRCVRLFYQFCAFALRDGSLLEPEMARYLADRLEAVADGQNNLAHALDLCYPRGRPRNAKRDQKIAAHYRRWKREPGVGALSARYRVAEHWGLSEETIKRIVHEHRRATIDPIEDPIGVCIGGFDDDLDDLLFIEDVFANVSASGKQSRVGKGDDC